MKCNTGFSKPGTTTTNTNFPSHRHGPFFNCTQNSVSRLDTNGAPAKELIPVDSIQVHISISWKWK